MKKTTKFNSPLFSNLNVGEKIKDLKLNGRYNEAIELLKKPNTFYSSKDINLEISDCYFEIKEYALAKEYILKSIKANGETLYLLGKLSSIHYLLNDFENFLKVGNQLLSLNDTQDFLEIHTKPEPIGNDKTKNIISFSIYGDSPRYCETAILNTIEAKNLYPNWTCRFYVDHSVPQEVLDRLVANGAELHFVSDEVKKMIHGTMWRFLVIDDENIDRFIIRDADSIVSTREQYAVNEWLESDKAFHIMRDGYTHTDIILAGMWGGVTGIIEDIKSQILKYNKTCQSKLYFGQDQHFLRDVIWKQIKGSVLHHDSQFNYENTVKFPDHPQQENGHENRPNFHVGWDTTSEFSIPSNKKNGEKFSWAIVDKENHVICKYTSTVKANKFTFVVPIPYLEKLNSKDWSVQVI